MSILVLPFDTANHLSAAYQRLVGEGIHQFLSFPSPMPLHAYDTRSALSHSPSTNPEFATLTLRAAYRAILLRDGHLTQIRAVGGTRDAEFDAAMVRAMEQLSASELLPAPSASTAAFLGDSLDLRIVVTPDAISLLPRVVNSPAAEGVTPLLRLRLPIRHITDNVRPKKDNRGPMYPTELRNAGVEGKTLFEFVVDENGKPDLTTTQVLSAAAPQFIKAVLDELPNFRFDPLRVEGCSVPVLVQMPFEFNLIRY